MAGAIPPPSRGNSSHGAIAAQLEAVLRPLFLHAAVGEAGAGESGGLYVTLVRSPAPGVVSVEFSGDLTRRIVDVCGGGSGCGAVKEVVGRLLNERLEEERRRSTGSVGAAEAVAWLREVAADVYGERTRDGRWGFACWHEVLDARRGLWLEEGCTNGSFEEENNRDGESGDDEEDSPSEGTISKGGKQQNGIQLAYASCEKVSLRAGKHNYPFLNSVPCSQDKDNSIVKSMATDQELKLGGQRKAPELPRRGYGNCRRKRVRIGCSFQANVPIWIGFPDRSSSQSDASDSKWLGTRLWPLEGGNNGEIKIESARSSLKLYSVMSISDNIRMARNGLKFELGVAFDLMGFNNMGEEVSSLWNWKEQLVFDYLVRKNPITGCKSFLYAALRYFPSRRTNDIVSYYFNVHVLRRMTFQTKLASEAADSDDDECRWSYEELVLAQPEKRHSHTED